MNAIKSIVAVLATVAATAVFAQEATPDTWITEAKSVASRDAVAADARAARTAGTITQGEAADHDFSKTVPSVLTRAQVAAEAREAHRLGLTKGGEVLTFATAMQTESIRRAGQMAITSTMAAR